MARKLTPSIVTKVKALRKRGFSQQEVAEQLGISKGSVQNAENGTKGAAVVGGVGAPGPDEQERPAQRLGSGAIDTPARLAAAVLSACVGDVARALLLLHTAAAELGGGAEGEIPADLTMFEVRGFVAGQIRGSQADAERCAASGDMAGLASAKRILAAFAPLAARVAKKDATDDGEFVKVRSADMDAAALRGREKIVEGVAKLLAERATWPRCPSCGQSVKPAQ